jgi:hypothetical protein
MRHFGQTAGYWEDTLTLRLHRVQEDELAEHPPAEEFLAAWFAAQGWWTPPGRAARDETLPPSSLPEFED